MINATRMVKPFNKRPVALKRSDIMQVYQAVLELSKSAIADAWYAEFRQKQQYVAFLRERGLLEEAEHRIQLRYQKGGRL